MLRRNLGARAPRRKGHTARSRRSTALSTCRSWKRGASSRRSPRPRNCSSKLAFRRQRVLDGGMRWRFSALVIAENSMVEPFREERPALGGHPGPGGWREEPYSG